MAKNSDLTNKSNKRNPLMIIYNVPAELKEIEAIEELIQTSRTSR